MAKTQTINVSDTDRPAYNKIIKQTDRFFYGGVGGKKQFISRRKKERLLKRSLFSLFAEFWKDLTAAEKDEWRTAAALNGYTNWQLFISDNAARLRHDLTPSQPVHPLWQVRVGRLRVESPATEIRLRQLHPRQYWEARSVPGKWWKEEPVLINEIFAFPLELAVRYKASLSAVGSEQLAQYSALVWSSYQGEDIFTTHAIDLSPSIGWTEASSTLNDVRGYIIGYELILHIKGYQGHLFFDNIRANHSTQNWARDPRCSNISRIFDRGLKDVQPFWQADIEPEGSSFASVFEPLT